MSLHAIVGLDRTASEVMALMSRSGSQQSQGPGPGAAVGGATLPKTTAAAGSAVGAPKAVPPTALPPPSRFSVFGKNLTNNTGAGPEVIT